MHGHWPVELSLVEEHEGRHSGQTNTTEIAIIPSNIKMPAKLPIFYSIYLLYYCIINILEVICSREEGP